MSNRNITIQTKQANAGQNAWVDGMVKTTASQVTEETNKKFVTSNEKTKIQSIPTNVDGIPLAGQNNLIRLYVTGDPAESGSKTISRVNAGIGPLPVIENGTIIYVFFTNGHSKSSLLINIEGGSPYPVKYFGSTNSQMISQIASNTIVELQFFNQAWNLIGALDYTSIINTKVTSNTPITPNTGTKITYDAKGLVTGSGPLEESDIPSIPIDRVIGLREVISTLTDNSTIERLQNEINTKVTANAEITPGTATKVSYDSKGLITEASELTESDIPQLSISKVKDLPTTLNSKIDKNSPIPPATATKITYDTNGLILGGGSLTDSDIPNLPINKINGLQTLLDSKVTANNPINPGTAIKVTYDEKGLIRSGSNLIVSDIPDIPITKVTGLSEALANVGSAEAISDLQSKILNKVDRNPSIAGGTKTKITYDDKGLVTGGSDLTISDIPQLPISKISDLEQTLESKLNKNMPIAASTKTKISYDEKGLITGGSELTADDIPSLDINKINGLQTELDGKASADELSSFVRTVNEMVDNKVDANSPISAGTATKVTYDSKGLVTVGGVLSASDIPNIDISQVNGLQNSLNNKIDKNATITAGTATKVTYDSKGLITAGAQLTESDIPTLSVSKITNLQSLLDSKMGKNDPITGKTATKVTYDSNGLITGGTDLSKDDIPNLDIFKINGLSMELDAKADKQYVDSLIVDIQLSGVTRNDLDVLRNDINSSLINKVDKNATIEPGTKTKITYDDKGLVTGGSDLIEADIPELSISKVVNLQSTLDNKVNKNELIEPGIATKITYDAKGLIIEGSPLEESDIPTLTIPKIDGLQNILNDLVTRMDFENETANIKNMVDNKLDVPMPQEPGNGVTKIWFDNHGLVIGGEFLTIDDLPNGIPTNYIDGLEESLDHNLLTGISFDYDEGDTTVSLMASTINLLSRIPGTMKFNIPLASATKPGVMPRESFIQIVQNTADIAAMKGANRRWAIHDTSLPDDTTEEGQNKLNEAYLQVTGNSIPNDTDTLLYVKAGNIAFSWFATDGKWINRGADTASKATNESLGLVQGENVPGKIFVENDGTMTLVGYNSLTSSITNISNELNNKVPANALISPGTATRITYDEKGLVLRGDQLTADDIPNISINKVTGLQDILNNKMDKGSGGGGALPAGFGAGTGTNSIVEGYQTTASGDYSHAEGSYTTASVSDSHAEGYNTNASGYASHAEGVSTKAIGYASHAEGSSTTANGYASHAEGASTTASGTDSHAEGASTKAIGYASHAEGYTTTADVYCSHVMGRYNKVLTGTANAWSATADAFVIGNGSSTSSLANAFRVTFAGATYGLSAFNSTGADYAEFFEWLDGNPDNEDRVGYFVTTKGRKIRKATSSDDYILGVVSATPSVIGDSYNDDWYGKYVTDEWGRIQYHYVTIPAEYDDNGNEISPERVEKHPIYNPDWDPSKEYIPREKRPEWTTVGMMGKLLVRDDGTCVVDGYCKSNDDGIATASDSGYKVIDRISNNIIQIIIK